MIIAEKQKLCDFYHILSCFGKIYLVMYRYMAKGQVKLNTAKIKTFLRSIGVFELLKPEQLDSIAQHFNVRHINEGEVLWLQGQSVTLFTIIYSGRMRQVRRSSMGSEKLLGVLSSGHYFGLAEILAGATSAVTIISDGPTTILTMGENALKREMLSNPDICYRMMRTMSKAIFSLTRELERASFENVHTRLARLLLKSQSAVEDVIGHSKENKTSHEQLSIQLGISRETVSRTLADFRKKGLIATAYRKINILNRDGLMEYIEDYDQW